MSELISCRIKLLNWFRSLVVCLIAGYRDHSGSLRVQDVPWEVFRQTGSLYLRPPCLHARPRDPTHWLVGFTP